MIHAFYHEWGNFAIRWLHVVTAIAWIGSSFYFIALDLGLQKARDLPPGASGEEWQVHGGGFYHIRKYLVAPEAMPAHLTWFKWESYSTWLSGFALLAVLYWAGAELYLIDPAKLDLQVWQAIALSAGSLAVGWIVYDLLCRSGLGNKPTALMLLLFVALTAMAWGYEQIFTGRAALLHLGAFTATIMTANVFLVIMPNQRIVVADLKAGRKPDPKYGKIAKLRSTHNNYLTLPVVFLMLSNHYPLAFASRYNWLIAALVFLMGVSIRHFFNTKHARKAWPWWTWGVTAALFAAIVWLSAMGVQNGGDTREAMGPRATRMAQAEGFEAARDIVLGRCSMCHAAEPSWEGIMTAPKHLLLETDAQIANAADAIFIQAGLTDAMPPANITFIEPKDSIRHFGVKLKLNPVPQVLKGRRVVVVDDSLVRGTTSRKIVKMIRNAGAAEVHLRISSPPVISPCYYGIDTPTRAELLASTHNPEEVARYITADSVAYLSPEGLMQAVRGESGVTYCTSCFTGDYPIRFTPPQGRRQLRLIEV